MMDPQSVAALLDMSPFVVAIVSFGAGWKACQHYAVKPANDRIVQAEARVAALEAREAELMRSMQKKLGLS